MSGLDSIPVVVEGDEVADMRTQNLKPLMLQIGQGEVSATLEAFGPTLLQETALPGVWLVEHKDAEGRRLTLHLEISRVPSILVTPEADIVDGLEALKAANRPPDQARDDQDSGSEAN